jgi:hypothetical protein
MKQLAFHAILAVGWCLAAASPPPAGAAQGDEREWRLADGTPVTVTVHPAGGRIALLWLPAGFGRASADEARLAEELVAQAIEVWRLRCSRRVSCRRSKAVSMGSRPQTSLNSSRRCMR